MSDPQITLFPPLSIGVLAGGKSSRMGKNKAFLEYENQTFIKRITKELGGFSEVLVSAAKKGDYESLGFGVVYDEHKDIGPIEGIYQVLKAAKEDYVFICASDMPFIKKELVLYLSQFISEDTDCIVIADEDHIHPLCAIYSKRALKAVEEMIEKGEYRIRRLFKLVNTKYVSLALSCLDKKTVKNVNTREEYAALSGPVVFGVCGFSDSGKTGLILRLINEFIKEGKSCACIKHDGHDCFSDLPGSDTFLFKEAGASHTVCFSEKRYLLHSSEGRTLEDHIQTLKSMKEPPDVIIIEGVKASPYPKVETIRKEICKESVCDPKTLICIASDFLSPDHVSCPVLDLNDTRGIFDCIINYFKEDI